MIHLCDLCVLVVASLILSNAGNIWTWGGNSEGELGRATPGAIRTSALGAVAPNGTAFWRAMCASEDYSVFLANSE